MTTPISQPDTVEIPEGWRVVGRADGQVLLLPKGRRADPNRAIFNPPPDETPPSAALTQVNVKPYLRRGEGGNIEQVSGYTREYTPAKEDEFYAAYKPWLAVRSSRETDVLMAYRATDYHWVNGALRGRAAEAAAQWNEGKGFEDITAAQVQAIADEKVPVLDAALKDARVPRDVKVYRGMAVDGEFQVGDEFTDGAYVSTSIERGVGEDFRMYMREFGRQAEVAEVRVPKGVRGAFLGDRESELLLGRGLRFRVVGTSPLVLEVIP